LVIGINKSIQGTVLQDIKKDAPRTQAGSQYDCPDLNRIPFTFEQPTKIRQKLCHKNLKPDFMLQFRSSMSFWMHPSLGRKANVMGYVLSEARYGNRSPVSPADVAKVLKTGERYAKNILNELERDGAILSMEHGYMVNPFRWIAVEGSAREAVKEKWRRARKERYRDEAHI
jgi:hypothetical protein